jgi:ketosteroid isomerase-like protein
MRTPFIVFIASMASTASLALGGCATPGPGAPTSAAPCCEAPCCEANKQVARRFIEALTRADSGTVAELYADDATRWTAGSLPFSGSSDKSTAVRDMDLILGLFPDGLEFRILAMTAEGERVAIEAESHGQHVSGAPYHNEYHFLLVIRDGRIHEFKEYLDTQHALEVLVGAQ